MPNEKHRLQGAGDEHPQRCGQRVHRSNWAALQTALREPPYVFPAQEIRKLYRVIKTYMGAEATEWRVHYRMVNRHPGTCVHQRIKKMRPLPGRKDQNCNKWQGDMTEQKTGPWKSSRCVDMPTSSDSQVSYQPHDYHPLSIKTSPPRFVISHLGLPRMHVAELVLAWNDWLFCRVSSCLKIAERHETLSSNTSSCICRPSSRYIYIYIYIFVGALSSLYGLIAFTLCFSALCRWCLQALMTLHNNSLVSQAHLV